MRFWTDTADVPGEPILVRARKLTALAAAVLAVAGLSACRSNVGAAAVVDGHRISESDVHTYLTAQGPTSAGLANAGSGLVPQSLVNACVNSLLHRQKRRDSENRNRGNEHGEIPGR